MLDQPGLVRAYKLVTAEGRGPTYSSLVYSIDAEITPDIPANTDELVRCGTGINLGDCVWVTAKWKPGYRILICEFTAADIAAIPIGSDGKFRVHRCKVVGEVDLVAWGLVAAQPVKVTS